MNMEIKHQACHPPPLPTIFLRKTEIKEMLKTTMLKITFSYPEYTTMMSKLFYNVGL
jgi:hypothetical protein